MVGRKAFHAKPKNQYHVSECGEDDCSANNKKNGDCYNDLSLSLFMDELWSQGKWWKEKLFMLNQSISIVYPNVENMSAMPNNKNSGDYENLILSHFTDEHGL